MCFSATASFTAGVALLVVGTVTVRRAGRSAGLAFAAIPLLFGIQQMLEGALWLTFSADAPLLNTVLTYVYSFFSHVLWPVYVPLAVLLMEPTPWRRKVLGVIAIAGAAVGIYLLYFLVRLPLVAQVAGRHIAYLSPHFYALEAMTLYLLGTCVSSLFSSHRSVRLFGVAAFLSFVAAYAFYSTWFISVWCFFAAVLSSLVLLAAEVGGPSSRDQLSRIRPPLSLAGQRRSGARETERRTLPDVSRLHRQSLFSHERDCLRRRGPSHRREPRREWPRAIGAVREGAAAPRQGGGSTSRRPTRQTHRRAIRRWPIRVSVPARPPQPGYP